jgi:iron complex outermembrane receptor protein
MLYHAKQWGGFVALGFLLLATPWAALAEDGKNSP